MKNPLTIRYKAQSCVSGYSMGKQTAAEDSDEVGEEGHVIAQAEAQSECSHRNASV